MESYKIKYLAATSKKIAKIHSKIEDIDARVMNTTSFKKVIDKIVTMDEDIDGYSYCLKKAELNMLCMYIPGNVHKVDLTNLFEIVRIRLDFKMAVILYLNWQNNYLNKDNIKIFEIILMNEDVLRQFKQKYKISPMKIISWIKNDNVEMQISKYCAKGQDGTIEEYKEQLENAGLKPDTKLTQRCIELFYSVCQSEEYFRIGDDELVEIIKKMKPNMARLMLLNMLDRLTSYDLQEYIKTAKYYSSILGIHGEKRYYDFFDKINDNIEKKYHEWTNYIQLVDAFGEDKRVEFWMMYAAYGDMRYYEEKGFIIMRFHDFVVVEFCGKYPTYWYNNVYFDQAVKGLLLGNSDKDELVKWLSSKSNYLKKRDHKGEWKMLDRIIMNNMLSIRFGKVNIGRKLI